MPEDNEILGWNVKILERHDKQIHQMELNINSIMSDVKVVKTLLYVFTGAAGLVGTIFSIIKAMGG